MGKVLRIAALVAAVAVNIIPGAGQAISAGIFAATGLAVSAGLALAGTSLLLGGVASLTAAKQKIAAAQLDRLNLSFDPDAPRKLVFGTTAMATDILYTEPSGTDQRYNDYIIAVAAHAVESVDAVYLDDKLFWSAGTVQSTYASYTPAFDVRLEGTSANAIAINGGGTWNTSCRLTGCAYLHIRIDRQGSSSKTASPFVSGLPGRMTIVGKGMKLYDPRRDSTRGGSGTMRANDQATWAYTPGGTEIGQNPALQALTYLLGWKIGGVISVGVGMDPSRIDFGDFITAANICDEAVALAAGGTHRRYETAGVFGDDADPSAVLAELCKHMRADLQDVNGKLGIRIAVNDLSGLPAFGIDDVLGDYEWTGFAALNETPNVIRGKWSDPSTASLYVSAPYSKVSVTSPDGIDRPDTLDLLMCQNAERAQRIATAALLRDQFNATFTADFGPRAWAIRPGQPLTLSFAPAGLLAQQFRVVSQTLRVVLDDKGAQQFCSMTLRAEDPSMYSYTPGALALPASAIPAVSYNPLNNPLAVKQGTDIGLPNDADNTAANTPALDVPPTVTIRADNSGAILSGQVPRTVTGVRRKGTTDVSSSTTWSDTSFSASITASIDTAGNVTITDAAGNGRISWVSTRDGLTLNAETTVSKDLAGPPSSTGGGAGTGGGSSGSGSAAYDTTIDSTSSTAYGAANAGILTVTSGSSGTVNLTAPLEYTSTGTANSVRGKWQWRVVGGTFADVASEVTQTVVCNSSTGDSGYITINQSKSGLTSGTAYEFQLLLRKFTGSGQIDFAGTATATPT